MHKKLEESFKSYAKGVITDEERSAAEMIQPLPMPLGLYEWQLTDGSVYAKGITAVRAQVGINRRAA